MCGIVCVFDTKQKSDAIRPQILEMSKKIRHRGPDWSGIYQNDNVIFSATGITKGDLLEGITSDGVMATTETLLIRGKSRTIRRIKSIHFLDRKDSVVRDIIL